MATCRFLITGARAPAALQLARILGRSGSEVVLADSMERSVAYRSKWIMGHVILPPPALLYPEFVREASKAVKDYRPDVILCTCEEIFYWAKMAELDRKTFAPFFRANPSFAVLRKLHHKGVFARLARSIAQTTGVIVPETRVRRFAETSSENRWVGKPRYSRFAVMTRLGLTHAEARECLGKPGWIVQKQIEGTEFCTWAFFVNGAEVCSTAYEPIYRAGKGSGIGLRGIDPGPAADFARSLAAQLNYTGQLAFDWIRNDAGSHVLECNPRSTSGVHFLDRLSEEAGRAMVRAMAGDPFQPVVGTKEDVAIKWAMLLFGARKMACPQSGIEQRAFFRRARDADRASEDPAPMSGTAVLSALSEIVTRSIKGRCGLIRASTSDIEWNGNRFWEGR